MKRIGLVVMALVMAGAMGCGDGGPKGPRCKACAYPMDKPELFGTEADGSRSRDYCRFCYQQGRLVEPDPQVQKMLEDEARYMQLQPAGAE